MVCVLLWSRLQMGFFLSWNLILICFLQKDLWVTGLLKFGKARKHHHNTHIQHLHSKRNGLLVINEKNEMKSYVIQGWCLLNRTKRNVSFLFLVSKPVFQTFSKKSEFLLLDIAKPSVIIKNTAGFFFYRKRQGKKNWKDGVGDTFIYQSVCHCYQLQMQVCW